MRKVRLKKEPSYTEIIRKFIDLGEPVPKIGQVYTVNTFVNLKDLSEYPHLIKAGLTEYKGYELEEFDWRELGIRLIINEDNFETVSDEFIPNKYIVEPWFEGHVEEFNIFMDIKFDQIKK